MRNKQLGGGSSGNRHRQVRQSSKERPMLDGNEERGFITGKPESGFDCDGCGIILANYDGSHRTIEPKITLWTTLDYLLLPRRYIRELI